MSKNVAMFVDVANLYYAARGQDVDVDYVALLKHASKGRDLIRAYAYSGLDPENENQRKFIDFLAKNGYRVLTKDIRKFGDGRVKANLDIELVVDLFRLRDRMDVAVIVSGDGDFAPAIRALQDEGVRCEVISFKPNTSSDLIAVADEFVDIMKVASISRKKEARGMSAPEMPAKEVTPEFGFREAPPSVAAAALAALRGGAGASAAASGRGRGRRRAVGVDEGTAESGAEALVATGGVEEPRRRRRRRGGRGRGRGRSGASVISAAEELTPASDGDITWQEFDDLSQLDGLEQEASEVPADREYSFEEADAETLRELEGLGINLPSLETSSDGDVAAPVVASEEESAAQPQDESGTAARRGARRGGGRTRTAAKSSGEEAKPKARTTRARKAADAPRTSTRARKSGRTKATEAEDSGPSGDSSAAPSRRGRRPRSAPSEESAASAADDAGATQDSRAAAASSEEEPQGIWGRFRSARKTR